MDFDFLQSIYVQYTSFCHFFLKHTEVYLKKVSQKNTEAPKGSIKSCSEKFRKIHMKTPLPEPLCIKPVGLHLY